MASTNRARTFEELSSRKIATSCITLQGHICHSRLTVSMTSRAKQSCLLWTIVGALTPPCPQSISDESKSILFHSPFLENTFPHRELANLHFISSGSHIEPAKYSHCEWVGTLLAPLWSYKMPRTNLVGMARRCPFASEHCPSIFRKSTGRLRRGC